MNKKDFKKQFINEFKQENTPTTSFNDVFKEQPKEENIYYKKYLSLNRKFKLSIAFSCIMLLVLIVGLSISIVYVKDYDSIDKFSDYSLTETEKQFMLQYSNKVNENPIAMIFITEKQYIIFYKCELININNTAAYSYFLKVINFSKPFSVIVNNSVLVFDKVDDVSLKLLVDDYRSESLYFTIEYQDNSKEYVI